MKTNKSIDHQNYLINSLQDKTEATGYLNAALKSITKILKALNMQLAIC